jgi:hypothetical protein
VSTWQSTSRDPLDGVAGTTTETNPYHYVDNDPLNKTDPTGERPADACLAYLPTVGDLQGYGLSQSDATAEHANQLSNCQYYELEFPNGPSDDTRTNPSGYTAGGGGGSQFGRGFSTFLQGASCISMVGSWTSPFGPLVQIGSAAYLCHVAAKWIDAASDIGTSAARNSPDAITRGAPGQNAARHFAWSALIAGELADSLHFDFAADWVTEQLTELHETFGLACSGTALECQWDTAADRNNNRSGREFGLTLDGASESDLESRTSARASELLTSRQLDLRGGCPSSTKIALGGC